MDLATKVMLAAAPDQVAPVSVREGDQAPKFVECTAGELISRLIEETNSLVEELSDGNVAIVCPDEMTEEICRALDSAKVIYGRAGAAGIEYGLTVVPVSVVKGLELDGVVVVEPAKIVAAQTQGLRALYVALTRSTRRLTVVHCAPLPNALVR
jgi:DNA helicase IV